MRLAEIATYVNEKISSSNITLDQYVTTDSLLQDKRGREYAQNLPPVTTNLIHYQPGDVLVANIRPYLKKVWFADCSGGASSDVLVFRPKNLSDTSFVYAILMQDAFYDYAMKGAKGSKMPRGDKDQIMRYEIPTFSLEQRKNIGKFIVDIESKITINRQINDNLEAMAKQLYDYWFVQFDFPNEEGKPYKSSGGKMVWNDKLKREIPEGWEVVSIGDTLDKVQNTPRLMTNEYMPNGQYPIIDQTVNVYYAGFTDREDAVSCQYPAVVFGDHSCAVKYINFPFVRGADGTQIMLSKDDRISVEYLYFATKNIPLREGYARHYSILKGSYIIAPTIYIAKLYQKLAVKQFELITSNRKEIIELSKQRDELLPLLMNGQVSPLNSD